MPKVRRQSRTASKASKTSKTSKTSRVTRLDDPILAHITILRRGTLLYAGVGTAARPAHVPLYLTPHRHLALMYARGAEERVLQFKTTRPLRLMRKRDALWAVRKGKAPRGEWTGFGTSEVDGGVAAALCRRRAQDGAWVAGLDGWVHAWSSPTLAEVLVCDPVACLAGGVPISV
tara:strand:- start:7860 stop:8384 length:525 start_codon:yes stop_codon:yes gene_type:complete